MLHIIQQLKEKKNKRNGFPQLTPEREAAVKKRLLEQRASLNLAYQLGYYVGEKIVNKFLPTLSVDMLQTRKNISVTAGEGDECRRLDAIWYEKRITNRDDDDKSSEEEWKALRAYHEMLEEKYLPKTIDCHFQLLNVTEENMQQFKKGVGASLWNCDCSHYSTKPEDIDVKADEDGWFTVITLKRD